MDRPICVSVLVVVAEGRESEFLEVMRQDAIESRKEPGCMCFHVSAAPDPRTYMFYEVYVDGDAVASHKNTKHYAAWDATIETVQKLIDLGVDVGYKAKGKLSAPELARKRVGGPGAILVELLDFASGVSAASAPAPVGDDASWEEWAPADDEWRKLIENDPFKTSVSGGSL